MRSRSALLALVLALHGAACLATIPCPTEQPMMSPEEVELFLQLDAQTLSLRSILQDAGHAVSSSPGSRQIGSGLMLFIIFR